MQLVFGLWHPSEDLEGGCAARSAMVAVIGFIGMGRGAWCIACCHAMAFTAAAGLVGIRDGILLASCATSAVAAATAAGGKLVVTSRLSAT